MLPENILKKKLTAGQPVLGTWAMLAAPAVINTIGVSGLDFVVIDMEHGPMSFETAENMVRAAESTGCSPIIRIANNDEATILRALEIGSQAVMVPHVSTAEEARQVVQATKYHPQGTRGLSPYTRTHGYTHKNITESLARANENTLTAIIVEGQEGFDNLDEIVKVEGLDLIYIGIYDLSQSIGLPGQLTHPSVLTLVEQCVQKIHAHNIAAGSFANNREYIKMLFELRFEFIAYLVDSAVLRHSYEDVCTYFNGLVTT